MAKKKNKRGKSKPQLPPGGIVIHVPAELIEAERLTNQKRFLEARNLLLSAHKRYPTNAYVLESLVNAAYDLKDIGTYEMAAERLVKLTKPDPDLTLALAGAYMTNLRPALSARCFRRFLAQWPDHPKAAEARATAENMEAFVRDNLAHPGLDGESALEVSALNEESTALMERGDEAGALRAAEELLRRYPSFVAGLNNLSQILCLGGNLGRAIATAQRALGIEPDNFHALGNLVRFQLLAGQVEEARKTADQLQAVKSERHDRWVKTAEALSFLGDDEGVLDTFARAKEAGPIDVPLEDAVFLHLVAVAALRLGREDEARRHWKRALELDPGLDVARQNLSDLRKPVGERQSAWPFLLNNWLPARWVDELRAATDRAARRGSDRAAKTALQRYLSDQPEVANLVPPLLDRGDPAGREFALGLAKLAGTDEMAAALRDFALSQRGPDEMRNQAAQVAVERGLLPSGSIRMWQKGEWHDVMLFGFEIVGEVQAKHSPAARPLVEDALEALAAGNADRGERLLQRALEIEPEAPDILYNLAAAYEMQERRDDFERTVRQVHERNPDYFFAITALAQLATVRGKYDEAKELLAPLLSRQKLHISEFSALSNAYVSLHNAQGNKEAAQSWLAMWRQASPDNPILRDWERRLARPGGILGRLGWLRPSSAPRRE